MKQDDDDDGDRENDYDHEEEERDETRKAALELMLSLTEARPSLVRRVDGWVESLVRACLEGMGELSDDRVDLEAWLEAEVNVTTYHVAV